MGSRRLPAWGGSGTGDAGDQLRRLAVSRKTCSMASEALKGISSVSDALLGFIGVLVGAVIGFLGSLFGSWVSFRQNDKNLFVQTVTNERAKWRQDLRDATGQLVQHIYAYTDNPDAETFCKIHEYRVAVRLRVNPENPDRNKLDAEILSALSGLRETSQIINKETALAMAERIELSVQKLLKQEWEKSKREAKSGTLEDT